MPSLTLGPVMPTAVAILQSVLGCLSLSSLLMASVLVNNGVQASNLPPDLVHRVYNIHQCRNLCVAWSLCVSFNYDTRKRDCELYSKPIGGSLGSKRNSVYVDISQDTLYGGFHPCNTRSCYPNEMCLNAHDSYQCLRHAKPCSPPPALANATVTYPSVGVYSVANYTCNENFAFFGTSRQSTCHPSRHWAGLSGSCERVGYYNVTCPFISYIPDTKHFAWKVEIIGVPLNEPRSTIELRYEVIYIAFQFDIRFNYGYPQRYINWNSLTASGWGVTKRAYPSFPFQIGREFNLTFVVSPVAFNIYVDEVYFSTELHRMNPTLIEQLALVRGIDVKSVYFYHPER